MMRGKFAVGLAVIVVFASAALAQQKPATRAHVFAPPDSIKFGPPPPSLPPGAELAVVSGDPAGTGPFVLRARVPAGYQVPPHWHPTDEHLTVISGTIALGMGEKLDAMKATELGVGSYAMLPGEMRHFFIAKTAAVFQIHGSGPFVLNYVNPADDPSKKKQ